MRVESVPITKDPKFPAAMRGARQRKQKQPGNAQGGKQRANAIGMALALLHELEHIGARATHANAHAQA